MSTTNPSKLTLGAFFALLWVLLPTPASAYNPVYFSQDDYPWYSGSEPAQPQLFRELVIQLCSIGIWAIWEASELDIGSGNIPPNGNAIYTGISGASRPDGSQILSAYGAGYYYFESYNSSTCAGLEDESFGSSSWAYFYVDSTGQISNANLQTTTYTPTVPIVKNIEIINPTYGTTTATTTFAIVINYKTPFSLDFRPTTTRHYEIVDALTGEVEISYNKTLNANSGENITLSVSTTTDPGSKYIRAMYLDQNGGVYSEVDEVFFNVATNTYYIATGLLSPRDDTSGLTQINCDTFDIGCQFQKALVFLFIPPQNTLDKFSNLWQTIAEKRPFGYVTLTIRQLEALDVSGLSAFDLGTIPFMDTFFTPFRSLLSGILWALFAIYLYQRRLTRLDI